LKVRTFISSWFSLGELLFNSQIQRAQELGAAGVLIYSDPRDDGFVTVENDYSPYPAGPARNPSSVQRGSVQFLSTYPGDPTTPGYPAYEDAERTSGKNIPKIPSLPISWKNAQRLFEEIGDLYILNEFGQKVLSGKASSNKIRLVNHGKLRFLRYNTRC
jgi:N-acetylated-alpha-linked acidic dipeptidase